MNTSCRKCHKPFEPADRIVANSMETFIFKGANAPDTVNPLRVSEQELRASRSMHKKTEKATTFITFHTIEEIDAKYFNLEHVECSFPIPASQSRIFSRNPLVKHSIRYNRSAIKGNVRG